MSHRIFNWLKSNFSIFFRHGSIDHVVSSSTIHYGQNLYQHQVHEYAERDAKSKAHIAKTERDEVLPFHSMNQSAWNPSNGTDYSSHLLSATLPISIQHILKYSESIKKESASGTAGNSGMLTGSDLLGLKNGVGSNLLGNVASMVNQHHLNHHHQHNFMNGSDNNMDHHHSSSINIPSHNSMLHHNQNGNGLNMKSPTMVPMGNSVLPTKVKKERKKSVKQPNSEKRPKKKKPPKERKPRPKVRKFVRITE